MPPPLPFYRRRTLQSQQVEASEASIEVASKDSQSSDSTLSELQASNEINEKAPEKLSLTRTIPPAARTSVIDLARMQQWNRLIDRITSHQREAKQVDSDGLTPLLWACSGGPPVEVIEVLLSAYPRAAKRVDSDESTALHFACHYGGSAQVIQALLKAYPKAVYKKDKYGRTPLYHAVSKSSSLDVLKILVDADPSMSVESCMLPRPSRLKRQTQDSRPQYHRTPLFMAWSTVASSSPQTRRRRRRNGKAWEKAVLLLEAANQTATNGSTSLLNDHRYTFRLLHAMVKLDSYLPPHAIHLALERFREQLRQPQEADGRLPLAIAAESNSPRAPELIRLLCKAYPQAARALDNEGQTPLVIALASGKQWHQGVETLFQQAPDILSRRDRKTLLYPALVAASMQTIRDNEGLTAASSDCNKENGTLLTSSAEEKSLQWRNQVLPNANENSQTPSSALNWDHIDPDSSHLSTIYMLLRASPTTIKR